MGSNSSSSQSKPLTGADREEIFSSALQSLNGNGGFFDRLGANQYESPQYHAPPQYREAGPIRQASFTNAAPVRTATFADAGPVRGAEFNGAAPVRTAELTQAGPARTLSNGDYDRLQNSMYQGATAGLDQAWTKRKGEINQSMADRGLWASGAAEKAIQNDYAENWTPAYERAGANAVQQRYAMQNQEQQGLNSLDSQNAQAANSFNLANTNMWNQGNLDRSTAQNSFNLANQGMINQGNLDRANSQNSFNLSNLGMLNQGNLDRANSQNSFNMANANMWNQGMNDRANAYNNYGLQSSQARNAWEADQASQRFQGRWRPLDYLAGLWNGTGGAVSSGNAGGWSI